MRIDIKKKKSWWQSGRAVVGFSTCVMGVPKASGMGGWGLSGPRLLEIPRQRQETPSFNSLSLPSSLSFPCAGHRALASEIQGLLKSNGSLRAAERPGALNFPLLPTPLPPLLGPALPLWLLHLSWPHRLSDSPSPHFGMQLDGSLCPCMLSTGAFIRARMPSSM